MFIDFESVGISSESVKKVLEVLDFGLDFGNSVSQVGNFVVVIFNKSLAGSNACLEGSFLGLGISKLRVEIFQQVVGLSEFKSVVGLSVSLSIVDFSKSCNFFLESCNSGFFWWDLILDGVDLVIEWSKSGNDVVDSLLEVRKV